MNHRATMDENEIGDHIVATAIEVHRETGPGLLETVYEIPLSHKLAELGLAVSRQVNMPLIFSGHRLDSGYRADLLVEDKVIVELKSVEKLTNVHHKQLLTYLRLSGLRLGYLLNFNVPMMKFGIRRKVNKLPENTPSPSAIPASSAGNPNPET